jgi:succinoglycan biosynthesis transport protein ExoP
LNGKTEDQDRGCCQHESHEHRVYAPGYYPYPYEDEIDLREYISILWKWRALIVSVTLLSVLTAGLLSFFVLKPVYEASTQIVASTDSVSNEVIKSPYFLAKVAEELDLPKEEAYTPFGLAKSISVQAGKSANLTVIKIEDQDPDRASDIVNTVARLYTDFVKEKSSESVTTTLAVLNQQRETAQENLDKAQKELDQIRQASRIEIMRNEVTRLSEELNQWRAVLSTGDVRQEELRIGIDELETLLASTPETIPGPPDYAGRVTQIPNQTYQQFQTALAEKQIEFKELDVRLTQARSKVPVLETQYNSTYEKYLEADRSIRELENQVNSLNSRIMALDAKIVATSTSIPEAVVATPALAPAEPVKPRKMLNMAVSAVLGGFVSILIVFFIEYWRSPRQSSQAGVQG